LRSEWQTLLKIEDNDERRKRLQAYFGQRSRRMPVPPISTRANC
jgi:hypothetical protein